MRAHLRPERHGKRPGRVSVRHKAARPVRERVYVVSGHYDSPTTDVMDAVSDAPGLMTTPSVSRWSWNWHG
jgi:hypothetical protein